MTLHNKTESLGRLTRTLAAAAIAAFFAFVPGGARAQNVVQMSVEELAAVSDKIVYGTAGETASEYYKGMIITRTQFEVKETLKGAKGKSADDKIEIVLPGGQMGKLVMASPGSPTLKKGEEVVLFLDDVSDNMSAKALRERNPGAAESPLVKSPQIVGGYQGKFSVVRQKVTEKSGARTFERETARVVRGGSLELTAAKAGVAPSLDLFLSAVRGAANAKEVRGGGQRFTASGRTVSVQPRDPSNTAFRFFDEIPNPKDPSAVRRTALVPIGKATSDAAGNVTVEPVSPDAAKAVPRVSAKP